MANLEQMAVSLPAILIALSLHEFGHAAMATKLGDPTPRLQGRLTLNPLAHLDPLGTLMIFMTMLSGFGIGWGKPVQTNPTYYPNFRQGMILTAIAGPAMNLAQASFAIAVAYLLYITGVEIPYTLHLFLAIYVLMNFSLIAFNLLPFPPLDGGHVVENLMPYNSRRSFEKFKAIAPLILLGMIFLGLTGFIMSFFLQGILAVISFGFGDGFVAYLFGSLFGGV